MNPFFDAKKEAIFAKRLRGSRDIRTDTQINGANGREQAHSLQLIMFRIMWGCSRVRGL